MLKLRDGCYIRCRNGRVYGPLTKEDDSNLFKLPPTLYWYSDGTYSRQNPTHPLTAVSLVEVKDIIPAEYVRYFNIYPNHIVFAGNTRANADASAGPNRIGCKRVVFTEGEWDD